MYEVLMKDKGVLSKFKWNYLMVDEAHRLNNSKAAVYVSHVEFRTKIKLLITGTPLQNNVEELRIGQVYEHIVKGILHSGLGDYNLKSWSVEVAEVKLLL
ncbi:protein CHROMATIN REMODELING 5-like [Apium graveolens]|uniref:protein CHROMATIN REMODELING 5-like n=1 Tax=Apium graveolens TaxID=4045 RepID=UPI003D7B1D72